MSSAIMIAAIWIVSGLYLVGRTQSRGPLANAIFVVIWPIHFVLYLLGRE
jgi:hypothetical protein